MSPRVIAILIGLFVVLAAGGVMLIPSGNEEVQGTAPGVLSQGDRAVPGRTGGGRGSGLMMNQGSRTVAAPSRPVPSVQVRADGSGPGFQSGERPQRAVSDRAVSEASGETVSPADRRTPQTVVRPQATPGRATRPQASSGIDRAAAERNADIARAQAIRDAQQRAQAAQRNRATAQRAAGRQNANAIGATNGQGPQSGDGTRTTGGTGSGGGSGGSGPLVGGTTGGGSASGGGGRPAGGSSSGQSGASGGSSSGGSGSSGGGSGGGGGGPITGGVPSITVTAEFRQVSINTGTCPDLVGHRTVDLFLVFSQQVGVLTVNSSGPNRIQVVGGSLVQVPGGGNGPPNAGMVAGSPCVAFDSYFDLGGVPLSFAAGPSFSGTTNQSITATWFTIAPAQTTLRNGKHELRVARFTAPTTITDITGTIGVGYVIPGLQGSPPSASVSLPSVASIFTGEPPPSGGTPPVVEEPEPEEPVNLFGACCFPNAVCQGDLTAGDCTALGGVYQGDGTSCAGVSCPAGPGTPPGGGGTPPGNGGGTPPGPGDDPNRPGEEPEEPEEPVGITGFWLAVDNGGVVCNLGPGGPANLAQANTFDLYLRMNQPNRLLLVESNPITSHLTINGGSVFQHPFGSNVSPNPNAFDVFPCLPFDSYLAFEDVAEPIAAPQPGAPSIIGLTASGGVGVLSETNWTGAFGALWFLVPPPSILAEQNPALFGDNLYYVRIGRFTLPSGVSVGGKLNASFTLSGSGQTSAVTAIPVPTVSGP